ncbi:MAG: hypothetical protein IJA86_04830 [Clostridia bacterium]|nr:hypothetical protein [Clostridia bacterium]
MKIKSFRYLLCFSLLILTLTAFVSCKKNHTHTFEDWVSLREPTCEYAGIERRYCSCGEYETRNVEPLGHNEEWVIDIAPTCTEPGTKNLICTFCKLLFQTEPVEAKGHTITDNWVVQIPATCEQEGESYLLCPDCRTECGRRTDILCHKPGPIVTEITESCTQEGKKCQYCVYCEKLLASKTYPKKDHEYITEDGQTFCKHCKEPEN